MDQDVFALSSMIVFLLFGLAVLCFGIYIFKHNKTLLNEKRLYDQLVSWQILGRDYAATPVVDTVARAYASMQSFAFIGMGCGIFCYVTGASTISLLTIGSLRGVSALSGFVAMPIFYLSCLMGLGLGSVIGIWRLHRATLHGVSYSDLRQRRLSDYRSPLLRWIPVTLVVWMVLITALVMPSIGPTIQIEMGDGKNILLSSLWSWGIVLLMLLILLLGEVLLTRIALLSRLLVLPDPASARRADDMLRSIVIGTIQGGELNVIAYLSLAQYILLTFNLWSGHVWRLHNSVLSTFLFSSWYPMLCVLIVGLVVTALLHGRLGGRVNGWPWRKGAIQ